MEKDISCNWKGKKSQDSNTLNEEKNDFKTKAIQQGAKALHNHKKG